MDPEASPGGVDPYLHGLADDVVSALQWRKQQHNVYCRDITLNLDALSQFPEDEDSMEQTIPTRPSWLVALFQSATGSKLNEKSYNRLWHRQATAMTILPFLTGSSTINFGFSFSSGPSALMFRR